MNTENYISTTISLVAAFLATGKVKLVKSVPLSYSQTEFHLYPKEVCEELELLYLNNELMVSASAIADKVAFLMRMKRNQEIK